MPDRYLFCLLCFLLSPARAQTSPAAHVPELVSPRPGGEKVPQPVVFLWKEVRNAVAYQIQISNTEDFRQPLIADQSVAAGHPRFSIEVLPSIRLWWRVRAVYEAKPGPWSDAAGFRPRLLPIAPPVAGITLNPAYITGGQPVDGLVTLAQPAPDGGAAVDLAISDAAAGSVPRHVEIEPGASSGTFTVSTRQVPDTRRVLITASSRGTAKTTTLTVSPPPPPAVLLSLSVNPATLTGGNTAQGTVRLASPAPGPRGVEVRLSGEDGLATVPQEVTVPAGQQMASFPVRTGRTDIPRSATISGSLNGAAKTASMQLLMPGAMAPLPAPEPESPSERETIRGRGIQFRWGRVTGAASYTLQMDQTGSFGGAVVLNYTLPDVETRVAPFAPHVYWWRVRANDSKGAPGAWSEPRPFELLR